MQTVRRRFPGRPEEVREVRRFIESGLGGDCSAREVASLLASEATTNAILHSASGGSTGNVEVGYDVKADRIRIEVSDAGGASAPRRRLHHDESLTGRGLDLFDLLASRWGVDGDPGGRTVWFELDLTPERAPCR